jgi:guanine deaminase
MTRQAFRAELVSATQDGEAPDAVAVRHEPDGLLVVEDGLVLARGPYETLRARFADTPVQALPGAMILPGFVDAHVHYPQLDQIASFGTGLLDWLERYIFPAEAAFADPLHARAVAEAFLDELGRNGVTSALVFSTVHPQSVDAMFEAALARDMRLTTGKVLMDRGPANLSDTAQGGRADTEALIRRWRGRGRLGYAVTPRFALTSSDAQLRAAAEVLQAHPEVRLHTHLAESVQEVAAVAARFPQATDYLDVYAHFGLLTSRSVFAHAIQLGESAFRRMAGAGAGIAFCPSSNLFLGSGLFNLHGACACGVTVGMGTDVGAGTSHSMFKTLADAYKVQRLQDHVLDPFHALYLATGGGARLMGIADKVGALTEGHEADFIVVDPAAIPLLARRSARTASLRDRLFALQILGDDRSIRATFHAGRCVHRREALAPC